MKIKKMKEKEKMKEKAKDKEYHLFKLIIYIMKDIKKILKKYLDFYF